MFGLIPDLWFSAVFISRSGRHLFSRPHSREAEEGGISKRGVVTLFASSCICSMDMFCSIEMYVPLTFSCSHSREVGKGDEQKGT